MGGLDVMKDRLRSLEQSFQDGSTDWNDRDEVQIRRGIEVGHIFQLGTKYSETMNAAVQDEQGRSQAMVMGCYGIGITRIVAAAIEQNHDDKGIIWPGAMTPFDVAIVPLGMDKSERVQAATEELYQEKTTTLDLDALTELSLIHI